MNLSLYAGTRAEAERIADFFREHPDTVYKKILDAFNEEHLKQPGEE